jgi:hypothetical protein
LDTNEGDEESAIELFGVSFEDGGGACVDRVTKSTRYPMTRRGRAWHVTSATVGVKLNEKRSQEESK